MKRTPLARGRKPLRRRTPLRKVSARNRASNVAYAVARLEVAERCGGRCEAQIEGVCVGSYEHTHHRRLRSQGGDDDPSNLIAVDHQCHDWIHRNPRAAAELGLIEFRSAEPRSSAVLRVEQA